ncbi:MAG: hypothetical protein A2381_13245 [Bdellovibrionales bacterium RIFOXYB1_FULL_37_110]|nr:MAG: hypothetical protein A2181_02570 [Bdellovibrionales bacterium RIFOXYA1_FULL_38_20]OFZ51668.1 MAG: hypothetical protein A2417_12905 [Bdellovibrionales bacterium RIFOXYC1_FULL_37_79]OFZ60495.1 MAG: hypothetical protein A2381_13245 [Bdellovibrionales bacterium RIFOXYB1_FULL_37_110]OFZ65069.1 MAG: hypothetical protein A2577_09510 [Bdellovibrionales bacterium RIFOXYD1_FULL_36_51]HAB51307.1 hypothetical protein [Ignavibacteriales bacterium]
MTAFNKMNVENTELKFKKDHLYRQNYQSTDPTKRIHGHYKKSTKSNFDSRFESEILQTSAFKNAQTTRLSDILNQYINSLDGGGNNFEKSYEVKKINDEYW